jgi:hypothetical protein
MPLYATNAEGSTIVYLFEYFIRDLGIICQGVMHPIL